GADDGANVKLALLAGRDDVALARGDDALGLGRRKRLRVLATKAGILGLKLGDALLQRFRLADGLGQSHRTALGCLLGGLHPRASNGNHPWDPPPPAPAGVPICRARPRPLPAAPKIAATAANLFARPHRPGGPPAPFPFVAPT